MMKKKMNKLEETYLKCPLYNNLLFIEINDDLSNTFDEINKFICGGDSEHVFFQSPLKINKLYYKNTEIDSNFKN